MTAVVFAFARRPQRRSDQHARSFLGLNGSPGRQGKLVADDFSGYKACFELDVTVGGCMVHVGRKFHELFANHGARWASRS